VISVGRDELTRWDGGGRVLDAELQSLAPALALEAQLAPLRVRAGVGADEDRVRARCPRDANRLLD
jgi:hypothetical protein